MNETILDANYYGWKISLLEYSGICAEKWPKGKPFHLIQNYSAKHLTARICINTNSLDGIKRMIHVKNAEIRNK